MKVTKVETLRADRFMYVKVSTDEGITGIGAPCGDQGLTRVLPPGAVWIVGGPGK